MADVLCREGVFEIVQRLEKNAYKSAIEDAIR